MGREVRMVPKDWKHPTAPGTPNYRPLLDGYEAALEQFKRDVEKDGMAQALEDHGGGPVPDDYMLVGVPASKRTHYMMYEDTSEGTPISPAFETPEELARWLADNNASAFAGMTASYDDWLETIKRGWAVSAVLDERGFRSGVEQS